MTDKPTMDINDFGEVLKSHGIRSGAGVPCSYFKPLVNYMGSDPELHYIGAASEGEAVAIAAGMTIAGRPSFALMQNSGLGNAVNPITSMIDIYKIPVVHLVSHRGQPDGQPDEPQHTRMGEITPKLIELCGLECHVLDPPKLDETLGSLMERGEPSAFICQKGTLTGGPAAPPIEFSFTSGTQETAREFTFAPSATREQALGAITPVINGRSGPQPGVTSDIAVIATTGKLSRELYEYDDQEHDKANRFYMVGSMGCAGAFGLGVAQGHPGRVLVIEGDGALLMKLGALATVGMVQPENFTHLVIDNAAHDSTGGQITASPNMDTASIALSCGYVRADTCDSIEELPRLLQQHLQTKGPSLIRMLVVPGARKDLGRPKLKPLAAGQRFETWLAKQRVTMAADTVNLSAEQFDELVAPHLSRVDTRELTVDRVNELMKEHLAATEDDS